MARFLDAQAEARAALAAFYPWAPDLRGAYWIPLLLAADELEPVASGSGALQPAD
jgi:hypothetical protein